MGNCAIPGCHAGLAPKKSHQAEKVFARTTVRCPASNSGVPGSKRPPAPVQFGIEKCQGPAGGVTCSSDRPLASGSLEYTLTRLTFPAGLAGFVNCGII